MGKKLIITLPLPPKELSPNFRAGNHWSRTRAVKKYREAACVAAMSVLSVRSDRFSRLSEATVECRFFFGKGQRFQDPDNLLASMKSCFDGLTDAGVFTDDNQLTHLPVVRERDRENPRVEIHINPR